MNDNKHIHLVESFKTIRYKVLSPYKYDGTMNWFGPSIPAQEKKIKLKEHGEQEPSSHASITDIYNKPIYHNHHPTIRYTHCTKRYIRFPKESTPKIIGR